MSFEMLKLGEIGEVSFWILKLGKLGEVSFGMLKLGMYISRDFSNTDSDDIIGMNAMNLGKFSEGFLSHIA